MGGVGKNPRPDNTQFFRAIMCPTPTPTEDSSGDAYRSFVRTPGRPDWLVTLADENPTIRKRLGRLLASERPLFAPPGTQVHRLAAAADPCRYCRSPRDGGRTTCDNCGAPYPALTL